MSNPVDEGGIPVRRAGMVLVAVCLALLGPSAWAADDLSARARAALSRAVAYYSTQVASHGGYLWTYNARNMKERAGESDPKNTPASVVWVQPPGTPTVGEALLQAYLDTGEEACLKAARAAGAALVYGQLKCGGWSYHINFDEASTWHGKLFYQHLKDEDTTYVDPRRGKRFRSNVGTFDDNVSQSALSFLMKLDQATNQDDPEVHACVERAIKFFLEAQFENGAWPQRFPLASGGYSRYYTFNDNAMSDCIRVMFEAHRIYGRQDCYDAAVKGGQFILDSAIDADGQYGWAQQYDYDMKPAWARRMEPPALATGDATCSNVRTLCAIYVQTGDKKFLAPIPKAIAWLKTVVLDDKETLPRYVELKTNRPLFLTRDYLVTYSAADCPTHYSFKGRYGLSSLQRLYDRISQTPLEELRPPKEPPKLTAEERRKQAAALKSKVQAVVQAMDDQGRWVDGRGWMSMSTLARNLRVLSRYVGLTQEQ